SNNCVPCHQTDYNLASTAAGAASVPNGIVHTQAAEPPANCSACHGNADAWQNATQFDHTTLGTGFPWKGAHSAAACTSCHSLAGVTLTGTVLTVTCASCHQSIDTGNGSYNSAT